MSVTKYQIRAADLVQDRGVVLGLWRQAFSNPDQQGVKYDWCYGNTAVGIGRLYLLLHAETSQVIGVQGIVPRRWWYQGEVQATGICADLVVDKQYRSIGPALALVRQVVESEQTRDDSELLYGFPNLKSEALYRRAGYTRIGEIVRYSLPLRLHVWLRRRGLPGFLAYPFGGLRDALLKLRLALLSRQARQRWRCQSVQAFDAHFDDLWRRVSAHAGPMVVRDSAFLRWRFGNNFNGHTQVCVLETAKGDIDAYVIYVVDKDRIVTILDFLAVDNNVVLPALIRLFVHKLYAEGFYGVTLEFLGPEAIADTLKQCGFVARETRPVYVTRHSKLLQDSLPYFTSCDRDQ